jgi:hypothetical protein
MSDPVPPALRALLDDDCYCNGQWACEPCRDRRLVVATLRAVAGELGYDGQFAIRNLVLGWADAIEKEATRE